MYQLFETRIRKREIKVEESRVYFFLQTSFDFNLAWHYRIRNCCFGTMQKNVKV